MMPEAIFDNFHRGLGNSKKILQELWIMKQK